MSTNDTRPTPETDAEDPNHHGWVKSKFARRLEQQRDEAREEVVKYRTALNRIAHPAHYGAEKIDPREIARRSLVIGMDVTPMPDDLYDQLRAERDEARAELADLKGAGGPPFVRSEAIRNCREQIAQLKTENNALRAEVERLRAQPTNRCDTIAQIADGNDQLRDNLDRLEAYVEQARDKLCAGKPDDAAKIIEHATDMAANWPDIGGYRTLRAENAGLRATLKANLHALAMAARLLDGTDAGDKALAAYKKTSAVLALAKENQS